ncbi:IS3 family transposase, partial [Oceanobacillus iheyensis]|uniref:IS3 family transposase n=1 Tax=Oceanobacillus iheyensis TaxID=182710 RepID=UPI0036276640
MRYQFIYSHQDEYPVVRMCEILRVSRSGYYNWLSNQEKEASDREKKREELKRKISQSFHNSFGTYGSPRIHSDLIEEGYIISQKTVARIMQEMSLKAIVPKKRVHTTDSNHHLHIYPNLLNQDFSVDEPNQVWVSDITYIWTIEGWVYLASVLDLCSRKIVGWAQAPHIKKDLALKALKMAMTTRNPGEGLIHHSDRGSQYCSHEYINELNKIKAKISMSRTGNPYDNACIESFHATIKKELIYRNRFNTRDQAVKAVNYYIRHFYNEKRKHS